MSEEEKKLHPMPDYQHGIDALPRPKEKPFLVETSNHGKLQIREADGILSVSLLIQDKPTPALIVIERGKPRGSIGGVGIGLLYTMKPDVCRNLAARLIAFADEQDGGAGVQ